MQIIVLDSYYQNDVQWKPSSKLELLKTGNPLKLNDFVSLLISVTPLNRKPL